MFGFLPDARPKSGRDMKFVSTSELLDLTQDIEFQIWARTLDLIPTEAPVGIKVGWKDKYGVYNEYNNALDYFDKFLNEDNKQFREPLRVRPSGIITNGNYRWHWAFWANMEFVPIDYAHLINKGGFHRDPSVIMRPNRSVKIPMGEWKWDMEAGITYPESLIQEGLNPKINMNIIQVMEWKKQNERSN